MCAAECAGWLVLGTDSQWHTPTSVEVTSATTLTITADVDFTVLTYMLADWPLVSLYNGAGLPAMPIAIDVM